MPIPLPQQQVLPMLQAAATLRSFGLNLVLSPACRRASCMFALTCANTLSIRNSYKHESLLMTLTVLWDRLKVCCGDGIRVTTIPARIHCGLSVGAQVIVLMQIWQTTEKD